MDSVELSLFASRISAVCDEMGAQLRHAAFSPNIRDRLDYSCAVFDEAGELCAQAAHIPVHLGSMAYAMRDITAAIDWEPGDTVILNDPFMGGTHLPDVTLISPLYVDDKLAGFVANRAHHADIGAETPGSMPISTHLAEEGQIISPRHMARGGRLDAYGLAALTGGSRNRDEAQGDFTAQHAANQRGIARLAVLVESLGRPAYQQGLQELNGYAERLARDALGTIPPGVYAATDFMDDDGIDERGIPVSIALHVTSQGVAVDFTGTSPQVTGNINCPLAVTAAAVFYALRCLMPARTPACAGSFRPIALHAPAGCLVNARYPAAVAAGNVETSSRIVDVVLGALADAIPDRIPACSQGTMNNLALGSSGAEAWGYYETLAGGMGAGPRGGGLSAVQTHMTNTRNTPIEVLEQRYPLRITRYQLRRGSGGVGRYPGGDGLIREYEFLRDTQFTLLTERRRYQPCGLAGGAGGEAGINRLNGTVLPGKVSGYARTGDRLTVETPGGGGWGVA